MPSLLRVATVGCQQVDCLLCLGQEVGQQFGNVGGQVQRIMSMTRHSEWIADIGTAGHTSQALSCYRSL